MADPRLVGPWTWTSSGADDKVLFQLGVPRDCVAHAPPTALGAPVIAEYRTTDRINTGFRVARRAWRLGGPAATSGDQ